MDTRKYKCPLGGDISLNKANKGRGWKGLKGQAALALAVSLWIGGTGVVSAAIENVADNTTISTDKSNTTYYLYQKEESDGSKGSGIKFTVEGPDGKVKEINGSSYKSSGNIITIKKVGEACKDIYGGVSNNEVTIETGSDITGIIYGGKASSGENSSMGNHVVIKGEVLGQVYGGYTVNGGTATGNHVEVLGGRVHKFVRGGDADISGNSTNNIVTLHNATVDGDVIGGNNEQNITGNRLILSGENSVGSIIGNVGVKNFASIEFDASKLTWNTTNPVLTSDYGFSNCGVLDVTGVQSIVGSNSGTMTLLKATDTALPSFTLAYNGTSGKTTAMLSDGNPVTVHSGAKTAGADGVTIGYNSNHTVASDNTNKAITYTVANGPVNNITLGTIAWNAGGTVFNGTGYDFSNRLNLYGDSIKNCKFTFANEDAYKSLAPDATMTLISNATGIHGSSTNTYQMFDYTVANGAKLNAWVKGSVDVKQGTDTLTYEIKEVVIGSVDLAGWDSTKTAFEVPNGWIYDGVTVTAEGFTEPTIDAGKSKEIITTSKEGFFDDDNITGSLKYKAGVESSDTANGVTLTGSESKGVKASDDGKNLIYARSNFEVSGISLGTITWNKNGTARALTVGDYTFDSSTAIDKSSFEFNTPSYLGAGDSMTLLSNATGLTAGDSIAHRQSYTNYDNCIKLNATLNGNITKTENTLGYTATRTTLDSVNLANWNGTTTEVPAGWTSNLGANSVKAAGFTAPNINAGTSKNILTTNTGSFFNDNQITGVMKYAAQASSTDTANGVALTGSESKGVKASNDGKSLVYTRSKFNVNNISFGTMKWGEPRSANENGYDFTNTAAIDATKLAFTFTDEQKAGLSSNSEMTLLSGAVNLGAGKTVTKANHTQTVNYTVANGAALSGTLTGTVSTAAEAVNYNATGMTLNSVDLTGWNGHTASVPDGWTSALGNSSITAVSVDRAGVAPGTERNILTSGTENFFNDNQITNALKYKEYAASSKTLSGVTLTSSESKGVKASDDGKNLVYARSKYNVSNISLGAMEWGLALTATYGYDYTNANLDFSKFTFTNPDAVTGSTILLDANNTIAEIAATEKKVSYGYSPVDGVTVDGIINGSYKTDSNAIKYTATANNATKLTFGNVEWKDSGALLTRPANITFNGASVDTFNINFTNISKLDANKKMILVSDFGTAVVTPTASKYKVNSILQGEGYAFYENSDLLFLVTKGVDGTADVTGNTEEIKNGATVTEDVIGATTLSGTAESNKANVSGESKVNGNVVGATTESGSATSNTANVESSTVTGNVEAAHTDSGTAIGNEVNVNGGSVGGDVAGAISNSGTISTGNTAKLQSAVVDGNVYGGKSTSGEVNTSIANVSGGSVKGSVYGGQTDGDKKTDGNQVKLEQEAKVQKDVYGGYSQQGTATGNKVKIDGAAVDGTIYGGKSKNKSDNNSVELDNGTVGAIVGGGCEEAGGNIVTITGGEVLSGVYGAKAGSSATNNIITMSGGKVNNVLYGGYADSATGITTGNTVTLYGTADVSNAGVFGGNGSDITGNVLNIGTIINDVAHSWSGGGQSVKNVANFETMNFVSVPWNKEKAAVTISDGTASDLSATKVNATTVHFTDTTSLKQGDTMTLLDEQKVAVDKRVQAGNITKESEYTAGSTLKGTGILSMDDSGNVIYKVTDKDSSNKSHNTVMGAEVGMAALSAGNDFVGSAVEGLGNSNNAGSDGLSTYANLGGGSMNVETGSNVKTHTWNAILAIGHKNEKKLSTTEYGAFFEYGIGNYSTFNGDERGDGSTRYTGGGILGKWKQNNGFYVEGSLRAGSIHDDANNVLRDVNGNPYSYTTDATYWGAHIGVGREIKLNKTAVLDLYAKYFYNHRGSVSFDAGGHYDLGAVESSVLRVGTRYTVKQNDNINYYGGLAVEHEFCGRASGFADGVAIRGADISGTSVRGEIGATFRPGEKSNVTLDLNLSGFAGKKQGLTGGLSAVFYI